MRISIPLRCKYSITEGIPGISSQRAGFNINMSEPDAPGPIPSDIHIVGRPEVIDLRKICESVDHLSERIIFLIRVDNNKQILQVDRPVKH